MKKWIKILLVIATFAIISVAIYFVLKSCNLTDITTIRNIIESANNWSMAVFLLILTIALILLCFVPLLNTALVFLGIALFGPIKALIICLIANFISSTVLFFIGDKLGENFAAKLIGKKELEHAQDLIDGKSKLMLPILFIIPGLPDEALILVAGMTKIKYWYLIAVSMIYHAIETALLCFLGSGLIDWASLSILEWIIVVNLIAIDIILLLNLEKRINKK